MANTSVKIETFLWKGQTRYKCPRIWEGGIKCDYDTYDLDLLRKHMMTGHVDALLLKIEQTANQVEKDYVTPTDLEFESAKFMDDSTPKT